MGNCVGKLMSQVIHLSEKFSMWLSLCSFVTCMILCLTCMLAFGVGLGYNYSFIDFKTKHTYIAGHYKKTRPTSYYGPGFYKPLPRIRSTRKKTRLVHRALEAPEVIEAMNEFSEDLPTENAMGLAESEQVAPLILFPPRDQSKPLDNLYFTVPKTLPTTILRNVRKFNNYFNVSTPRRRFQNEDEVNVDFADKSSNHHQNNTNNTTKEYSGPEAIRIEVAEVANADNSSISNTIMNLKQLLSFLTMLREKKKKFSVQVITL